MKLFDKFRKSQKPTAVETHPKAGQIVAPADGEVVRLADVGDPVFAGGVMGQGLGIKPNGSVVYAPVAGTVRAIGAPNYHAIGITGDAGEEVIIHIGVDTVEMKGEGFSAYAEKGAHVAAGEPLVGFSSAKIRAAGYDDVVIMVVTNSSDYASVTLAREGDVKAGEPVLDLSK